MTINRLSWAAYGLFVALAIFGHWAGSPVSLEGPLAVVKLLIWASWLGFTAYSVYCSSQESLFKTVAKMSRLHWGRQVGADLYIGLGLALLLVYLHEGPAAALLWALPTLAFGNLSILLYFALHFDSIVARFLGT